MRPKGLVLKLPTLHKFYCFSSSPFIFNANTKSMENESSILDYVIRVIILPFFMLISLVVLLRSWVTLVVNYVRFGGELITYNSINQRKSILDIYNKLNEQHKSDIKMKSWNGDPKKGIESIDFSGIHDKKPFIRP